MLLKMDKISKFYGDFQALKAVDLQIEAGEIHGLVGKNGSGKSTLLKLLGGDPDIRESDGYQGQIYLNGQPLTVQSAEQAAGLGLALAHQELGLLGGFSIARNLTLGRENTFRYTRWMGRSLAQIDYRADCQAARQTLAEFGLEHLEVNLDIDRLSVNLRHFVEIAREISQRDLKLLVLDEPTAALNRQEAAILTALMRKLAGRGIAILFVSHRLEEILEVSDNISVLNDGTVSARLKKGEPGFNAVNLAHQMIGHSLRTLQSEARPLSAEPLLRFEEFGVEMPGERLSNLNLTLHQGEILGLSGLAGEGQIALGYGLMGIFPSRGKVSLEGRYLELGKSSAILASGIYFLSEDRQQNGLLPGHSLAANIAFPAVQINNSFCRRHWGPLSLTDWTRVNHLASDCIRQFEIHCRSIHQEVRFLSGGNQQKVRLAAALALRPRILIAAEPTRGVDVSARQSILKALLEINRRQGCAIICISSEPEELRQICDRIAVVHAGEAITELSPQASDLEFSLALMGVKKDAIL
jgi:simple sugar transport system ATP-binding protein